MPMHRFPGEQDTGRYPVLCFDRSAAEADDPDGTVVNDARHPRRRTRRLLSTTIVGMLRDAAREGHPYTDVFVMSHGWLADLPGAYASYDAWIRAVQLALPTASLPPGYRPLVIALHWPSRPSTVWKRSDDLPMPFEGSVPDAGEPHARPGPLAFAASIVPTLSFYAMKELAARTGRQGLAAFLVRLQTAVDPAPRIHLMGHSFGAKLVAEALADRDHRGVGPVDTMFLAEGALSTWAFAGTNPYRDPVGAAAPVFARAEVRGVAVASTSRWDWALGRMFPAAQVVDTVVKRLRHAQLPFARLHREGVAPRLAALGTDGFSGTEQEEVRLLAAPAGVTATYGFRPGHHYRLVSDDVVNTVNTEPGHANPNDRPLVGAHSNIAHPELARAYLEAAFPGAATGPAPGTGPATDACRSA